LISLLQDELADTKNRLDRTLKKFEDSLKDNKTLSKKVESFAQEAEQWKEFSQVVEQVEQSGMNYLNMMKGIKSKLPNPVTY
jgi:uncharacterized membrane-anchored protein YjiN (DUF445 family)